MTATKRWGTVCSLSVLSSHPETDSFTSCCQSLSPYLTHHLHHSTGATLLNQRAARSPSILKPLGEERGKCKVTGMKCPLGRMPNSRRWENGRNPFDYRGLWRKVDKQIRATTRKHSLVFTVKTLDTSGIFLERPSLFTSRLRFRRA